MKKATYKKALEEDIKTLEDKLSPKEIIEARRTSVDNSIVAFEKLHKRTTEQLKRANTVMADIRKACKNGTPTNLETATKLSNEIRVFEAKLGKYLEVAKETGTTVEEREALIGVMVELADDLTENTAEQAKEFSIDVSKSTKPVGDDHDRDPK